MAVIGRKNVHRVVALVSLCNTELSAAQPQIQSCASDPEFGAQWKYVHDLEECVPCIDGGHQKVSCDRFCELNVPEDRLKNTTLCSRMKGWVKGFFITPETDQVRIQKCKKSCNQSCENYNPKLYEGQYTDFFTNKMDQAEQQIHIAPKSATIDEQREYERYASRDYRHPETQGSGDTFQLVGTTAGAPAVGKGTHVTPKLFFGKDGKTPMKEREDFVVADPDDARHFLQHYINSINGVTYKKNLVLDQEHIRERIWIHPKTQRKHVGYQRKITKSMGGDKESMGGDKEVAWRYPAYTFAAAGKMGEPAGLMANKFFKTAVHKLHWSAVFDAAMSGDDRITQQARVTSIRDFFFSWTGLVAASEDSLDLTRLVRSKWPNNLSIQYRGIVPDDKLTLDELMERAAERGRQTGRFITKKALESFLAGTTANALVKKFKRALGNFSVQPNFQKFCGRTDMNYAIVQSPQGKDTPPKLVWATRTFWRRMRTRTVTEPLAQRLNQCSVDGFGYSDGLINAVTSSLKRGPTASTPRNTLPTFEQLRPRVEWAREMFERMKQVGVVRRVVQSVTSFVTSWFQDEEDEYVRAGFVVSFRQEREYLKLWRTIFSQIFVEGPDGQPDTSGNAWSVYNKIPNPEDVCTHESHSPRICGRETNFLIPQEVIDFATGSWMPNGSTVAAHIHRTAMNLLDNVRTADELLKEKEAIDANEQARRTRVNEEEARLDSDLNQDEWAYVRPSESTPLSPKRQAIELAHAMNSERFSPRKDYVGAVRGAVTGAARGAVRQTLNVLGVKV